LQLKVVGKLQLKVVGKLQLKVFSWGCGRRFPERLLKIFESLPKVSRNFAVKVSSKFAKGFWKLCCEGFRKVCN